MFKNKYQRWVRHGNKLQSVQIIFGQAQTGDEKTDKRRKLTQRFNIKVNEEGMDIKK
jgi:hypothetical protein